MSEAMAASSEGAQLYQQSFYEARHAATSNTAAQVADILSEILPPIRSAFDLGCGVGTWLNAFRERGADSVDGYDGPWVDKHLLQIPAESFHETDLSRPFDSPKGRDLAISLEVAEHLPDARADGFVEQLARGSDFVLFSAATPGQGGKGHINEQWLPYWIERFSALGFVPLDVIRKHLYQDTKVPAWYRRNVLLYVKRDRLGDLTLPGGPEVHVPPEVYLPGFQYKPRWSLRELAREANKTVQRKLKKRKLRW